MLPEPVIDMREALVAAARSGRIEELKGPWELGELRPDIFDAKVDDPVAHWKAVSADGEGREVLAVLSNLLELEAARLPLGQDPENTGVYVWPYLAELPLESLTPGQEVDLLRLMPVAEAKAMRAGKSWTWWRLVIGADGTWHAFKRTPALAGDQLRPTLSGATQPPSLSPAPSPAPHGGPRQPQPR